MGDFIVTGEAAIAKLEERSLELSGIIAANFPPKTLEQVGAEFEAQASSAEQGKPNTTVAKLSMLVREQAAISVDDFKSAEMWIALKAPAVSDGNNTTETEGDKTTVKSSKSSKTSNKKPPQVVDFECYVNCMDVKQYFNAYTQLVDMRNCYAKANALFAKNQKRLA